MNLIISSSLWTWIISFVATLSFIAWLIIRKKKTTVWFPISQIIRSKNKNLPKFKFYKPPMIPLITFLISMLCLIFLSFKPSQLVPEETSTAKIKTHIFIDMSPSVSATTSLESYLENLNDMFLSLQDSRQLSFSTSYSSTIYSLTHFSTIENVLRQQQFHRPGAIISTILKKQFDSTYLFDELIIVSDRNPHSWNNFNWQYFKKNKTIHFLETGPIKPSSTNYYILEASYLTAQSTPTMEWNIILARTGTLAKETGDLSVSYNNQVIKKIPWTINEQQKKTTLNISWPKSKIKHDKHQSLDSLSWEIIPTKKDLIEIDNHFFTYLLGFGHHVLIVADPMGEDTLEDPAYQLEMALESLNYQPHRIDWFEKDRNINLTNYHLAIFFINENERILDQYCPKTIKHKRQNNDSKKKENLQQIWLAPQYLSQNFYPICNCYHYLATTSKTKESTYCQEQMTMTSYNNLMESLGAKKIGGYYGKNQAIGWLSTFKEHSLLSLTVPLRPSKKIKLSYANFPILIKSLTDKLKLENTNSKQTIKSWPRTADITTIKQFKEKNHIYKRTISNIPIDESSLKQLPIKSLPPAFNLYQKKISQSIYSKRTTKNPQFWLHVILFFILISLLVEILFYKKKKKITLSNLTKINTLLFIFFFVQKNLYPIIHLNYLSNKNETIDITKLSKEVSFRTSIDLDKEIVMVKNINQLNSKDPWLWSNSYSLFLNKEGKLKEDISKWIKRGGFLIIEKYKNFDLINQTTTHQFYDPYKISKWMNLSTEHELLRSFYLFKNLQSCDKLDWKGLDYDNRLAILLIPFNLIESITNPEIKKNTCLSSTRKEQLLRYFINILLVTLTTDYKKDQVHTQEILKRLH